MLPNSPYHRWTDEERNTVRILRKEGKKPKEIAKITGMRHMQIEGEFSNIRKELSANKSEDGK